MKTRLSRKAKQLASSLLVVLVICTLLCLGIGGYLSLMEQQNLLSYRSQSWNIAIAIVEAGIEEGLQQLNSNSTHLESNGWAKNGFFYTRTTTLADGNSYTVTIDFTDSYHPFVTARASVGLPAFAQSAGSTFFATIGGIEPSPNAVARAVRVSCGKSDLLSVALVAKHVIDLNGQGIYTDSYNSSSPLKSGILGHYDSTIYSGDRGDIASNGGIIGADYVGIQNANIYGTIHTGPNEPVQIGVNGGVGPHCCQVGDVNLAIEKEYILRDANFTFPDTTMPSTAGLLPPPDGTIVAPVYHFNTNYITSPVYPNPEPVTGVITNRTYHTVTTMPNPFPPEMSSNATWHVVSSLPSPVPPGTVTNITTRSTTSDTYPAQGTYVGGVTVNYNGNSGNLKNYSYNQITSITYSYPTYEFTYPTFTYIYNLVATTIEYTTNYYNHILYANATNSAGVLDGKTYIAGANTCLILPNGLTGSEDFTIAPGASVLIYSGGSSATINGNQVINPNGYAGSFLVYCTPSVTTFTLNGNGEFTGCLVAPNANMTMNGGGFANTDFCGSLMVNNVKMNGHFRFHWDEALDNLGDNGRYIIASWDEIDPFQ